MADYITYLNGEWLPLSQAKIGPLDRGFRFADSVVDVERTFNGKSFRMKEHIDRLYRSLKYVRIDPGLSPEEMLNICEEAVSRNEHLRAEVGDFTINQNVTRGPGPQASSAGPPTVLVRVGAINFSHLTRYYRDGASAVVVRTRSHSPDALDPKVKHHSRMNFTLAELEAEDVEPGAYPLLTDTDGNITEGIGYNVFLVTDGVIRTPGDRSLLQGVSRAMVFDLARQLEISLVEEDLQPYDLYTADEAFLTSTSPCVLPITRADKRQLGDGRPGPISQQLLAAWSEAVGMDIVDQAARFDRE